MSARRKLLEVAVRQDGFVTSLDRDRLGLPGQCLRQLAFRGLLFREATGVFRFPGFPVSAVTRLWFAVLWTGRAEAVLSHETVLRVAGLVPGDPELVHVTVGRGVRVRRSGGDRVVVHDEDLLPSGLTVWDGVPGVTVGVALRQVVDGQGLPVQVVKDAIAAARARGLLSAEEQQALTVRLAVRNVPEVEGLRERVRLVSERVPCVPGHGSVVDASQADMIEFGLGVIDVSEVVRRARERAAAVSD